MTTQPFLEPVMQVLSEKGYTDEQIDETLTDLTKSAFMTLYTTAMEVFTEEDIQAIENCETDAEADKKIMALYEERTGNNAQKDLDAFLQNFVKEFLAEQNPQPQQQS